MAMDILLTKPVLEDNNQETNKDVEDQIVKIEGRSAMDGHESLKPSSPNKKDSGVTNLASQLESARADMVEVKEENERLKMILARIMKDYQTLQMHFIEISQQDDGARRSLVVSPPPAANTVTTTSAKDNEEAELVSLSLGSSSTSFIQKKVGKNANTINTNNNNISDTNNNIKRGDAGSRNGLSLGLDCKFDQNEDQSPENSYEELKVEEVTEGWPPNKLVKAERGVEDEVAQQAHVKKARVSVRARCDAPTMQDGCQWRKYGQKIAKGNPCPRAYYRCTVAPACPVRKQVQRCAEDMSILITTYEGTHNHPLTLQATAMASTTSAAASMLMSGSSIPAARTSASSGLIFDLSDNSRTRPFYLTNLSLSTPATYPTITLDLTSTSPVPQFSKLSSAFSTTPRYSSSLGMSNFNFSTDQNTFPASWNSSTNTNTSYFNYGSNQFKKSSILPPTLARPSHEQFYQAYLNKPNPSSSLPASGSSSSSQQNSDTIVAATKAITSDPSFRSALAAAITSIVSTNSSNNSVPGLGKGENALQNFTWGEQFSSPSPMAAYSSGGSVPGYGPSFLNRSSSANWDTQQGNLFQQATSLPFSSAKSTISSASRANDISKEHKN